VRRVLAALAAVALLPACGVPRDEAPRALDPAAAPFRLFQAEESPAPTGDVEVQLWFVRGDRVVPTTRLLQAPAAPEQVVGALFAGLTDEERAAGLSSAVPAGISVSEVRLEGRVAVVTLEGVNEQVQVLAYAQVVATLDGLARVDAVRFRDADRDLSVPTGNGSVRAEPVTRADYAQVIGLDFGGTTPSPVPPPGPADVAPGG
jgi:hypothetical protein